MSQMGPEIDDGRVYGFDAAELRAHAQDEHHEEEQHRPELRKWHQQHGLLSRETRDRALASLVNEHTKRLWFNNTECQANKWGYFR